MKLLLSATLLSLASLYSQTPAFPVESIRVTGSKLYPEAKLIELTGLKTGERVEPKVFEQAQQRLLGSGALASAGFRYEPAENKKGYAVTFEVADIDQIYPMRFDRLNTDEAKLRAHLKTQFPLFDAKIPGTKEMTERIRQAVAGYTGSAVDVKVTSDGPGELYVLYYPAGAPPVVAEVRFQGNQVLPAYLLQNTMNSVATGTEFQEARFRDLLERQITPLYEARGRLRVTYGKISIEPLTTVKGLRVSVAIEEGSSYSLGKVAVSGTMSLNEKLAEVAALKPGDLANFEAFREGQEKIHQAMRNAGYMKVSSEMHRELDDAKKVVDIRFEVAPGPEFHFGKLLIAGLDIHGEHEVRRLWGMDAGKRFNASYPNHFLAKLQEDNVFENLGEGTRAEFKLNDAEETVDVTLRFAAPKPAAKIK